MNIRYLPIAILLASTVTAASAASAETRERVTARVSLEGINLMTSDGMARLESRLHRAARRACQRDSNSAWFLTRSTDACIAEMVADGLAQGRRIALRSGGGRVVVGS
ncbi:MAG: UrcA family protein [Sphingopyxis sp.]